MELASKLASSIKKAKFTASVGARCALIRKSAGKTQLQVAMAIGTTPETISAFENGRTNNCKVFTWYLKQIKDFGTLKALLEGLDYG